MGYFSVPSAARVGNKSAGFLTETPGAVAVTCVSVQGYSTTLTCGVSATPSEHSPPSSGRSFLSLWGRGGLQTYVSPLGSLRGLRRMAASPSPPSASESPQQTPVQRCVRPAALPVPRLTDTRQPSPRRSVRWGIRSPFPRWFGNWDAAFTALGPAWISHQAPGLPPAPMSEPFPPELWPAQLSGNVWNLQGCLPFLKLPVQPQRRLPRPRLRYKVRSAFSHQSLCIAGHVPTWLLAPVLLTLTRVLV